MDATTTLTNGGTTITRKTIYRMQESARAVISDYIEKFSNRNRRYSDRGGVSMRQLNGGASPTRPVHLSVWK